MFLINSLRRRAQSLLAGGAVLAGLVATAPLAAAQPADYSDIEASPAMWLISDEDSQVYLFGTFHLLPSSLDWRTDDVDAALASAETVYLEADVHSPEAQMQIQTLLPQYGLNPAGVTLSSMLDDETRARLEAEAAALGLPLPALEPMRPWLAQVMLAVTKLQALGFDPNAGVETVFIGEAAANGASMGYFETAEQQLRFFADMSDDIQAAAFAQGLDQIGAMEALTDEMVRAWATGDMVALDRLINESMRDETPEVYQTIIVRRNQDWVPQIAEILEGEGVAFVAVGAAHLPGENGVVELMRDAGHTVTRQ
ncbi:TraB/GumN family protein [Maricaulis sp. CAU 1757]